MKRMYDADKTDQMLVRRIKKKDKEAFEILFNRYLNYVKTVIVNTSNLFLTTEDKEEVAADVFVALWRHADGIDETRELRPYIAQITRNMLKNKIRSVQKNKFTQELSEDIKGQTNPELKNAIQAEMRGIILSALSELPQIDVICFLKYYYYSMTTAEIAEELRLKESTVKSKLSRGRKKLKGILEERGINNEYIYF